MGARPRYVLLFILALACSRDHHPASQRRNILLVPIGPVPADLLGHLREQLPAIVKSEVTIAPNIAAPESAFDASRHQYVGSALLADLKSHDFGAADRVVGIIDADAYAPGLNFIFGQAMKPGRFAVVALPRLRESFRGRPDDEARFRNRALKETVHELGHTFGFEHCDDRRCVMHFSNSLGETDYKTALFCSNEQLPE